VAVGPIELSRGEDPASTRPLKRTNSLYLVFANSVKDASTVLRFVSEHGPLTQRGLDRECGEFVSEIVEEATIMRQLIRHHGYSTPRRDSLSPPEWGDPIPYIVLGKVDAFLVRDRRTKAPRIELQPATLLDALRLQLAESLSEGRTIRDCRHCGTRFEAGPGTRRRGDAEFCSKKHQILFNSLKRSRRG
jgi:hypothetical protein